MKTMSSQVASVVNVGNAGIEVAGVIMVTTDMTERPVR